MNSRTVERDRSEMVLRWIAAALAAAILVLAAACREDGAIANAGDASPGCSRWRRTALPQPANTPTCAPPWDDGRTVVPSAPAAPPEWVEEAPVTFEEAEAVYRTGRYGEAMDLFIRYVERKPTNPWGHYMLGIAAWKGGHLELAEAHLVESLLIDPNHAKGRVNLARVLIDLGQGSAATEHAALAEALNPESVVAKRTLARALAEAG